MFFFLSSNVEDINIQISIFDSITMHTYMPRNFQMIKQNPWFPFHMEGRGRGGGGGLYLQVGRGDLNIEQPINSQQKIKMVIENKNLIL